MEGFQKVQKLADGETGVVYKVRNLATMKEFAMKRMKAARDLNGIPRSAIREISLLKELQHPNIVQLHHILFEDKEISLMFECLPMSLRKLLNFYSFKKQSLSESLMQSYIYQISAALSFCHQRRVFHRDLCPENLLVDRSGVIKLSNFSKARCYDACNQKCPFTVNVTTLSYRAPELLLGTSMYDSAIDIWSLGCIFAELLKRKPLFHGDSEINHLFEIFKILGTPSEKEWPQMLRLPYYVNNFPQWSGNNLKSVLPGLSNSGLHLLKSMLKLNPMDRVSAKWIHVHHYFQSFVYDSRRLPLPKLS